MIRRFFLIATLSIISTACSEGQPVHKKAGTVVCKCIGVSDGDTITVLTANNKQYKVRLAHIDCPEKGQPFGKNAKQFTSDFCFGKTVEIEHFGKKDRNGRIIGVVLNEAGDNLNQALVEAGMAWHYKKYSTDAIYTQLEEEARATGRGLWQDANPVAPWEWRK